MWICNKKKFMKQKEFHKENSKWKAVNEQTLEIRGKFSQNDIKISRNKLEQE